VLGFAVAAAANGGGGQKPQNQNQNQNQNRCSLMQELRRLPVEHLGDREARDLRYLLEEEKLARDVYLTVHERWELTVFHRIAGMERSHMAWARALVYRYELEDPIGNNGLGVFSHWRLQELYEELSALAAGSVERALLVAVAIEEMDIRDLREALERSNNDDLDMLYRNLLRGSRNHLRVFGRLLAQRGVVFDPAYMSLEKYQELVQSPLEGGVVDAAGERLCSGAR
jgi:hypothetical protein